MSYIKLVNRADIYTKTTTTNAAGQKKPTWTLSTSGVHCYFVPSFGVVRVSPTYEEREFVNFFFKQAVNYSDRILNVVDRKGNEVEAGPFEVIAVLKQPGWSGKVHHYQVTARRVIE